MIQPTEEVPGAFGHPNWKVNLFAAAVVSAIGIAMIISIYLIVYGIIVLSVGVVWAVASAIVGIMQERADSHRDMHHHTPA